MSEETKVTKEQVDRFVKYIKELWAKYNDEDIDEMGKLNYSSMIGERGKGILQVFDFYAARIAALEAENKSLRNILHDVWNQFAIVNDDGHRWAGGLSVLEDVEQVITI